MWSAWCNSKWCSPKLWKNIGLLALRISVAMTFVMAGYFKLSHMDMATTMFAGFGFPMAGFTAGFVGVVEVICGLAVLLGVYTRYAAKLLAILMIVAILFVHVKNGDSFQAWNVPFVLLGSCLALAGVGGGKWQLMRKGCGCGNSCNCGKGSCGCGGKDKSACGSHEERMKNGDMCCKDEAMNTGEKKM